jgi:hypothetical protein
VFICHTNFQHFIFKRRGDVAEAESLIDEMIKLAEQGKEDLRPTIRSYASLVSLNTIYLPVCSV